MNQQFWVGIVTIAIAASLGGWGTLMVTEGWQKWKEDKKSSMNSLSSEGTAIAKDFYKLMVSSPMQFKYPGPLLFLYNSQLGKTISPISIALFIEVVNNKPLISRIYSIETRALMRYDDGGKTQVAQDSGGYHYSYNPR